MKWPLAFLVAIYALAVFGLAVFQRRLLYFPDRRLTHPAEAGMSGVEELRLMTDDGQMLVAWRLPPRDGHPLISYFHGNGGALVDSVPRFRMFAASGYGFLAVSYRGYGGSTGSPSEAGLMRDGEAAYREARARGYESDHIVLMGESLGTGVAIALAATHDAALVLDSPYSSAVDVAAVHYRMLQGGYSNAQRTQGIHQCGGHLSQTGRRMCCFGKRTAATMWVCAYGDVVFGRKRITGVPGSDALVVRQTGSFLSSTD